ncbi:MAG: terminase family protein [Nitrospirales bacterium]|nr:terminase family protein [Nitrospirales bacterium]
MAKAHPLGMACVTSSWEWIPAKHLQILNEELCDVAAGKTTRLIVTLPPRHGKSELISHYFPAWFIGRFSRKKVILASYEASFAEEWGAKARDLLLEWGEAIFGVTLKKTAANKWTTRQGGGMQTAGVGGAITGKGAHVFIIDDPVKNAEEASSPVYRKKAWDWYRSTAYTRLEPGGALILVMTRWNEDDMAGRIIKQAGGSMRGWKILNIPATCEDETQPIEQRLGRKNGDALWDARYNKATLENIRQEIGSYWYSALYQQRPAPLEGNIFKREWFNYYQTLYIENEKGEQEIVYELHTKNGIVRREAKACWILGTMDLAVSEEAEADFTVVSVFAVTEFNEIIWLECAETKIQGPDQPKLAWDMYNKWQMDYMGVEDTGYQLSLVQDLMREGMAVKRIRAERNKIATAITASVRYENGKIFHPYQAHWLVGAESQLISFPNAGHDDIKDTVSMAAIEVGGAVQDLLRTL